MGWLGKVVGGAIGLAVGGPIGAIAGAAFGHSFDKKDEVYLSGSGGRSGAGNNDDSRQMTFFVGCFSMLAKVAKADGRITEAEIQSIEDFMVRDLHLDAYSRDQAVKIFRAATNSPESFESFARQFHGAFRHDPQLLEVMLDILVRVAASDGTIATAEDEMIRSAVSVFGFYPYVYEQLKTRYTQGGGDSRSSSESGSRITSSSNVSRAYATLGVEASAADDEIKKQYRKLVREYHPDTIASKGLPEEFTKFAEEKFREIQEAWDEIKKARGIA